ncbi:MAG: NAD(P)/FAD-dependent oxidoreductase [Desulfurococcaceae archaeon]|mgnify:CR=1 FL=1|jgi:glycerol-3-phosphate dehydrogenase
MSDKYRVVIVGAGVVGSSIARVLSMYENFDITLVEKEPDVGWGASKANTSIVHPGHEEEPDVHPLRAKLCVKGNEMWRTWAKELEIPVTFPGELMVFTNDEEEKKAREYIKLARLNNVPGVRIIYQEELRVLEPNIAREAKGAVYAPTGGLISPFEAVIAVVENAVENGVKLMTETEVLGVKVSEGRVKGVETNRGFIEADIVINAAGLYSDKITHSAGVELNFQVKPRKGEYLLFDEDIPVKPTRVLHTTPTPITKGVYAITTVHGNVLIGPTAEDLPIEAKGDASTSVKGLDYVYQEASKLLREMPPRSRVIRTFAGLRPEPPGGHWLIKAYSDPWGFVNAAGIRSPGFTSAPAIAEYVANLISETFDIKLVKKTNWNPYRRDITRLNNRPLSEIDELIKKNPAYGEIVCYCKTVSKAEILEAVDRMIKTGIKTITLDGLKFRTYAGFGMCQGAFCRWRIAKIVSEKLGVPLYDVTVKRTKYGIGDVKTLWVERKG